MEVNIGLNVQLLEPLNIDYIRPANGLLTKFRY